MVKEWATLYLTLLGQIMIHGNTSNVSTFISTRSLYATYDVTDLIVVGDNAIGVMLGNGTPILA